MRWLRVARACIAEDGVYFIHYWLRVYMLFDKNIETGCGSSMGPTPDGLWDNRHRDSEKKRKRLQHRERVTRHPRETRLSPRAHQIDFQMMSRIPAIPEGGTDLVKFLGALHEKISKPQ